MKLFLISVIGAVSLCGCTKEGSFWAEGSLMWHNEASVEDKAAYFKRICTAYGFEDGTNSMRDCIVSESRASLASAQVSWNNMTKSIEKLGE